MKTKKFIYYYRFLSKSMKKRLNILLILIGIIYLLFINEAFNDNGTHNTVKHLPNPSAFNCRFCVFKDNEELCNKGL
jgi:hypothetical protein